MESKAIIIVAIVIGVAIGAVALAYSTTRASRPDEREFDAGPVRTTALGNFSNRQAIAMLEEEVRLICEGVHPNASRSLTLVRK